MFLNLIKLTKIYFCAWRGDEEETRETLKSLSFFSLTGQREVDILGLEPEGAKMACLALLEGHMALSSDFYIGSQRHGYQERAFSFCQSCAGHCVSMDSELPACLGGMLNIDLAFTESDFMRDAATYCMI